MKESVLHKIWETGLNGSGPLKTTSGSPFTILHKGTYNTGDGPDFRYARIRTEDGLILIGDIEIHVHEHEWYHHKHHTDPTYNSVILHVVLHTSRHPARTQNGYQPMVMAIPQSAVTGPSTHYSEPASLPCSGHVRPISEKVLQQQFNRARREYFEAKVNRMTQHYDPCRPLSEAWPLLLARMTGDGLGISRNREPMAALASALFLLPENLTEKQLADRALELSGLSNKKTSSQYLNSSDWDLSGSRPGNKPQDRIPALAVFIHRLKEQPPRSFRQQPEAAWKELTVKIPGNRRRFDMLRLTVYLPLLYLLGNLIHDNNLKKHSFDEWEKQRFASPSSIRALFRKAGFSDAEIPAHLGVVHQYRKYCGVSNCGNCGIMRAIMGRAD